MNDDPKREASLGFLAALGVPGCGKKASEEEFNKLAAAFAMWGGPMVNEALAAKLEVPKMVLLGEEVAMMTCAYLKERGYNVQYQQYRKDRDCIANCLKAAEPILRAEGNVAAIFLTQKTAVMINKDTKVLELQGTKIEGFEATKMEWEDMARYPYMQFDLKADGLSWKAHLGKAIEVMYIAMGL